MYPPMSTVLPKEKPIHQSPPSCKALCKRRQHCWPTFTNIVKCHILHLSAHPVACCCMLLGVVVQSLSQQLPTFLLFCDHQSIALQSCICLHSSCSIVSATHVHYQWFSKSYGLYLSHNALQVPTLLHSTTSMDASMLEVVASVCT